MREKMKNRKMREADLEATSRCTETLIDKFLSADVVKSSGIGGDNITLLVIELIKDFGSQ